MSTKTGPKEYLNGAHYWAWWDRDGGYSIFSYRGAVPSQVGYKFLFDSVKGESTLCLDMELLTKLRGFRPFAVETEALCADKNVPMP